uniref:Uncharacterized protein LOC108950678 n=1 Tax=Phallusia mammillata TaxID=59560 RepID=A0A6F9DIM7_9ASCI|nr:uncharacterized protein LOC108950678 [Phallusia mammillata]
MLRLQCFLIVMFLGCFMCEQTFQVCHETVSDGEYVISKPPLCKRPEPENVTSCKAKVYHPSTDFIKVKVFMCQVMIEKYTSVSYFFGAKTHEVTTIAGGAPLASVCEQWSRTHKTSSMGDLVPLTKSSWSTRNKLEIKYHWPTSAQGSVRNAILTESVVLYDHINKVMKSALGILSNCNIHRGACTVGTRSYVWSVPDRIDCPVTTPLGTHELLIHFEKGLSTPYRMEIRDLGMSIHHSVQCSSNVGDCYGDIPFCAPGGLILVPENCSALRTPFAARHPPPDVNDSIASSNPLGLFLTELSDTVSEGFVNVTADIHYLECQLTSLLTTIYSLLARQYPGETLSQLLGIPKAAITIGDVVTAITCEPVSGTVIRDLRHGNLFATRPLIQFKDPNGNHSITGQYYRDGYVYKNIKFLENYVPGRIMSFKVGDVYYTYENYTLAHVNSKVHYLTPQLAPVHYTPHTVDYQSIMNEFPRPSTGLDDMTSILMALSQARLTHDKLYHYINSNLKSNVDADMDFVAQTAENVVTNVFIAAISNITSPFIGGIMVVFFFLALIWGGILTFWALKHYLPIAIQIARGKIEAYRKNDKVDEPKPDNGEEVGFIPTTNVHNVNQIYPNLD